MAPPTEGDELTNPLVGRTLSHILTVPPHPHLRWFLLWPSATLGHESQASTCPQDATLGCGSYLSNLRHEDGRYPERQQSDHEQYRWSRL